MSIPSVNANARDVSLKLSVDLKDSLRCPSNCCFNIMHKPKSPEEIKVYVTSQGIVEAFDAVKASGDEARALKRSLMNVMGQVDRLAERRVESTEKVVGHIEQITADAIRTGSALTLAEVNRIKRAVAVHLLTPADEESKKD